MEAESIIGPFFDIESLPVSPVRLLRRFGTWEQHGGATEPTCRLIDDAREGGQNRASGSQFTHRPTDLDAWSAQVRAVQEKFPTTTWSNLHRTLPRHSSRSQQTRPLQIWQ